MHIVVVTRNIARAAFYYGPTLRALMDTDTRLTLLGAEGTDLLFGERQDVEVFEAPIRPMGAKAAPMEWAIVSGALVSIAASAGLGGTIDVLLTFEADLCATVTAAARAVPTRLIVTAADAPARGLRQHALFTALAPAVERAEPLLQRLRSLLEAPVQQALEAPREQVRNVIVPVALGVADGIRAAVSPLLERTPERVQTALEDTANAFQNAGQELRRYLDPPPTHYLLVHDPGEPKPEAGWTTFEFATGIDTPAFLPNGQGRIFDQDAASGADLPMRVGVWCDPWGTSVEHTQVGVALERCGARETLRDVMEVVAMPPLPTGSAARLTPWAAAHLAGLDVAVVPRSDLYAAMQASAAGVAVITVDDSVAARALRVGESGLTVAALDPQQLSLVLESFAHGRTLARMQDAAQRRAVRLFGSDLLLRRLVRGMDDHLQMDVPAGDGPSRVVRRHL